MYCWRTVLRKRRVMSVVRSGELANIIERFEGKMHVIDHPLDLLHHKKDENSLGPRPAQILRYEDTV